MFLSNQRTSLFISLLTIYVFEEDDHNRAVMHYV